MPCQTQFDEVGICEFPNYPGPGPYEIPGHFPECFVGMPGTTDAGISIALRDLIGCDSGCMSCDDRPENMAMAGDGILGTRWLRPDEANLGHRDAFGMVHDLKSNEPHLVPKSIRYIRGTCWSNDGLECFGTMVCRCGDAKDGDSCEGVPRGTPQPGLFSDKYLYLGNRWPLRSSGLGTTAEGQQYCRQYRDTLNRNDHQILASAGVIEGLMEPVFIRSLAPAWDPDGPFGEGSCADNMLIACTGFVSGSDCPGSFINPPPDAPFGWQPPLHWNSDESRARFDEIRIRSFSGSLRLPDTPTHTAVALIEARNAILAHTAGIRVWDVRFDRLDHQANVFGSNGTLGQFWRFAAPDNTDPTTWPVIPGIFGPCKLRRSRLPVACELRLKTIRMTLSLVAYRYGDADGFPWCEPHARVKIKIECAVTAQIEGFPVVVRDWYPEGDARRETEVELQNVGDLPRISPAGFDTIVFADSSGRPMPPPILTEWFGHLGYTGGTPNAPDQRFAVDTAPINTACHSLANGLESFTVPAMDTAVTEQGEAVYDGAIVFGFD